MWTGHQSWSCRLCELVEANALSFGSTPAQGEGLKEMTVGCDMESIWSVQEERRIAEAIHGEGMFEQPVEWSEDRIFQPGLCEQKRTLAGTLFHSSLPRFQYHEVKSSPAILGGAKVPWVMGG